jgi:hypothetical protein
MHPRIYFITQNFIFQFRNCKFLNKIVKYKIFKHIFLGNLLSCPLLTRLEILVPDIPLMSMMVIGSRFLY